MTTFEKEVGEIALVPGSDAVFEVRLDRDVIFSRTRESRFPELKELKQLVRDRIAPDKDLGHSDRKRNPAFRKGNGVNDTLRKACIYHSPHKYIFFGEGVDEIFMRDYAPTLMESKRLGTIRT